MRADLLAEISADLVLLPPIWLETHSYVLTLALRTGLPVAAFDLGACNGPATGHRHRRQREAQRANPRRRIRKPNARLLCFPELRPNVQSARDNICRQYRGNLQRLSE